MNKQHQRRSTTSIFCRPREEKEDGVVKKKSENLEKGVEMQLISKNGLCAFAGVRVCPKQSNTDERVSGP